MRKRDLERTLNRLRSARDAADWRGRFTHDIRVATIEHRQKEIAQPLDEAISIVQKALDRIAKKRKAPGLRGIAYTPYSDD